jgi:hypothetical protein
MNIQWQDEYHFQCEGLNFISYNIMNAPKDLSSNDNYNPVYIIAKPKWRIESYKILIQSLKPKNIVEIGLLRGGSCVFLDILAAPEKLVAIEYRKGPIGPLHDYIESHSRQDSISTHYNTNQADTSKVRAIINSEFNGSDIDLVIDDASHLLEETRTTFNCIFPHLRAGGVYIIEDWSWAHQQINKSENTEGMFPDENPLTILGFELLLVLASTDGIIKDIRFDRNSIFIERGTELLDQNFDISKLYHDRGARLLPTQKTNS